MVRSATSIAKTKAYDVTRMTLKRRHASEAGLCTRCCKMPRAPDRAKCPACLDHINRGQRGRRLAAVAAGLKIITPPRDH